MQLKVCETVFVFDLDDTLYRELDYVLSGKMHVFKRLSELYGLDLSTPLDVVFGENDGDFIGRACEYLNLPITVKETLLWDYRLHSPNISLSEKVSNLIHELSEDAVDVAILTDGRSLTQRLKLRSLGLDHLSAYISEEYESAKPNPKRFELIAKRFPQKNLVYVGDNPAKDFLSPNNLGWITFGVKDRGLNIHSQELSGLDLNYHPRFWLSDVENLKDYLC
jgi:putative hydrolase of the HAD superfamily